MKTGSLMCLINSKHNFEYLLLSIGSQDKINKYLLFVVYVYDALAFNMTFVCWRSEFSQTFKLLEINNKRYNTIT